MARVTAVVFDLDGTLVDSAPDLHVAVNGLLAEHDRATLTLPQVTYMIGEGAQKLVERAFAATGTPADPDALPSLTRRFLALYEEEPAALTRLYDGVDATLSKLRADGYALGIGTNKPEAASRAVLRDMGLADRVDAVVGGDTLPGVRKPDGRLVLAVLDELGARPADAAMVGDTAIDVGAARDAGIPVIVREGGYTRAPATALGADSVIQRFADLPEALARLP